MSIVHPNIFASLFQTALPHMTGYQADLGWDAITLSRAREGDRFLWGYRELGTHLAAIPREVDDVSAWAEEQHPAFTRDCTLYLITVTTMHMGTGCAEGTIELLELPEGLPSHPECLVPAPEPQPVQVTRDLWQAPLTPAERA